MATLQYPYYSIGTQTNDGVTTSTKSVTAVNLPTFTAENRDTIAGDLEIFSQLIASIIGRPYAKTTLTTREEVNA